MISISIKSQPHRAYGFRGDDFLSIFFFSIFGILVSMETNKRIRTGQQNHLPGGGLIKEHFNKSFVKISAMA